MADEVVYNSSLSHLQKDDKIVAEILHRLTNAFYRGIRYNIFRKLKNEQKDRHAQKTLVE